MEYNNIQPPNINRENDGKGIVGSGSSEHLATCSLVLDSVGIPYRIYPEQSILTVPDARVEEARYQLDRYFEENANWPERSPSFPVQSQPGRQPTVLLIGCLAVFYMITGPWNENTLWFANGAINSLAILEKGEWWRLVTALTLHADLLHLAGNCIIGGFLVHMLTSLLGSGTGWLLLVGCGAAGNFLNIAARETVHYSVGFSTSIFGAIGLFSGLQILAGRNFRVRNLLIPLGAGAGLLAMLGVEGERTDLGAHFFGFICGLMLGLAARHLSLHRMAENPGFQRTLLLLTLASIIICWLLAMK
ncbi:MAG: rhomboid family intramembrane serine protease [Desulfobulbaceae bacterium]|nr:rhomboid family intramembrane serine protease [Desulfobulbaceae bacterium]